MESELEFKIKIAESNLQQELNWIGRHDTRIAFVTGTIIAMLGVLANASTHIMFWNEYLYFFFGLSALFLFSSLISIYFSQFPKIGSRNSSLIFFGTVALLKFDEYKKKFREMSREEYFDDLLSQIHINAEILNKKFVFLKSSLILLAVAIIPWLVGIYLSGVYLK